MLVSAVNRSEVELGVVGEESLIRSREVSRLLRRGGKRVIISLLVR